MKTIFISYAWESEKHNEWVKQFADDLASMGDFEVLLDQNLPLGYDIPHFMEKGIERSDKVLIIGTPTYKERSDNLETGVAYEGMIISAEMMGNIGTTKFYPILREGSFSKSFPMKLKSKRGLDFSEGNKLNYQNNLKLLADHIANERPIPVVLSNNRREKPLGTDSKKNKKQEEQILQEATINADHVEISEPKKTVEKEVLPIVDDAKSKVKKTAETPKVDETTMIEWGKKHEGGCLVFKVGYISFKMIRVEGGSFMMGATIEQGNDANDSEKPSHQVTLSSYYIGETVVTQELWELVMGDNPSHFMGVKRPVENISWEDVQNFIRKLNENTKSNFRLPTEAEWEFAARGGNNSKGYKYSGSNTLDEVGWYVDNSSNRTHNVAVKKANELGLYDMSGNILELCSDWFGSFDSTAQTNPKGPKYGAYRVLRGGSWFYDSWYCRVSSRRHRKYDKDNQLFVGIRLVLPG